MKDDALVIPGWVRNSIFGLIGLFVTNIIAVTWWAATLTTNQNFISQQVVSMNSDIKSLANDRYRSEDAKRDFEIRDDRISRLEVQLNARKFQNVN